MDTNNLFLYVVALDTTVAQLQNLGCLIKFSFADEPPWRFRDECEDDADKADHRPLETRVNMLGRSSLKVVLLLPHLAVDWNFVVQWVRLFKQIEGY
jgi:hypothetical protein